MNLELKKFDMKSITFKPGETNGPVIVFIGRRDTGKSFFGKRFIILSSRYSDWDCDFGYRGGEWILCELCT